MSRIRRPVSRGKRLLVVDDDPDLLRSTERLLRRRGYEVRTAADGDGALAALREDVPDGILLDWYLRETTAEALLPTILRLAPDTPILIVSGWSAGRPEQELMARLGVAGVHDKGDGAAALLERVDAMLAGEVPS